MSASGFTRTTRVVEVALPEDPGSGHSVGQPDGVVHVVPAWGEAFRAQHADDQKGCVADEHVLAQGIRALGERFFATVSPSVVP